ncbi:TPA: 30S ribosomal protein S9 [Candidatus Nomurabacteria bacterium]|nr:MAG: 30S ribosomal protein S9 [Candidatus Nomurabacteria bacterium GW2011_GWE2_36_115]KKP94167.1 MAG: 30S ribosomal protein S9 [Candidatus Nomurabacteria bacterium GW2011_GWF2_36_126]KKP96705.1 MAG: 30S ribosomal protein S9 [Candidatus Nomurabacteria bacterium GW2011_GWD2_36_14]KKP99691.1 MAG: 30S ribosomal protein S9 [Candidatus Nomurabacteria bacterium GW2011_GWF2_36_19]KKQ05364.1 MAG: 30S ribosomal protein S9 [Candidatus Nomurabacteria bacterium GW2011_GWF1_36_47]KKQ09043.1 MAG: 30S ribo
MAEKKITTKEKGKEYFRAIGRRKTAVAVVRLYKATKTTYKVNGKDFTEYFATPELKKIVTGAFETATPAEKFEVVATTKGGGSHAQAEAVRHGISRALVLYDAELRSSLKKAKMLKRDPRVVERKKFGLKKARKSPQWSKR